MASVISKTPNEYGVYRFLENINVASFNATDWVHNPDVSLLVNIPIQYWKYDGINVVEMTATEKAFVDISTTVSTNETGSMEFAKRERASNAWLRSGGGLMQPSNKQPLIVFDTGVVTGLTFSNLVDGVNVDIIIYKNSVELYTWEIRNKRYAFKTNGLASMQFETGDTISIYIKQVGTIEATWAMVNIEYKYTIQTTGEGGAATL